MAGETWLDVIIEAFQNLGGEANYSELYPEIKRLRTKKQLSLTAQSTASVRRTIEDHSSDSANFRADDLFYKIGLGYWGLRNHKENKSDKIVLTDFDPDLYIDGIIKEKLISLKLRNQKLVLERKEKDNFTCQACGFYYNNKIVECHHLVPLSDSKLTYNSIDDLITLCPNCHALAHSFLYIDDIYQKRELLLKKIKEVIQNM